LSFIPLQKLGRYKPTPLEMNLITEIQTDQKRNLETLPSTLLLFLKWLLPQCGDFIAPCTS
jgi:hypothetical protein